jgi:hypothetical protein
MQTKIDGDHIGSGEQPGGSRRARSFLISRSLWLVLLALVLVPAFALADDVEIGYLIVESTCVQTAPGSTFYPEQLCSGSINLFNEMTSTAMVNVGLIVGGVMYQDAIPETLGGEEGEPVQYQGGKDVFVSLPSALYMSVQVSVADYGLPVTIADLGGPDVVAGTFNLSTNPVQSLLFHPDIQFASKVPLYASGTPFVPPPPAVPEPGTGYLVLVAISILFVARRLVKTV